MDDIEKLTEKLAEAIDNIADIDERIAALNRTRETLHRISPFKGEPVDFVKWVRAEDVVANDYNPNKVASPEMELLYQSIKADGFTQPIVSFPLPNNMSRVVDGFHRNRVGKEKKDIRKRLHGYLPVAEIEKSLAECVYSTVRHNRARGKHGVAGMSDLIVLLKNDGISDKEIAKNLGMSGDELVRLKAQTGIAQLYANEPYSRSWIPDEGEI